MSTEIEHLRNVNQDLIRLRDELVNSHSFKSGDTQTFEIVMKINSCLGKGYPRRTV